MREDKTVIPTVREPVIAENRENMDFLSGQKETLGQISKVVTEMRKHNFILINDEEAVSQEDWFDEKEEEESNEDEGEVDLSHDKRELVLELKEAELVTKISQKDEKKLWNVINKEE